MEQVRLLSNFETATTKLLQILLVGQPELKAKLDLPELRQLKQRIGLRCQIPPLTLEEAHQYIRNRLRIAGARDLGIFSDAAIERMTEYSGGIPRVLNILGDHCLLFGYADQTRRIERSSVNEAIEYMEQGMPTPVVPPPPRAPSPVDEPPAPPAESPRPVFEAPRPVFKAPRPVVRSPRVASALLDEHLVSLQAPSTAAAEQYRVLRHLVETL